MVRDEGRGGRWSGMKEDEGRWSGMKEEVDKRRVTE